jgi:hypothetical protein
MAITAAIETISPSSARTILDKFDGPNRPTSRLRVDRLAEIIGDNHWRLNGQPIIFGTDGLLLDGKHRLTAIANGERTVEVLVVRGIQPEVMDTIDRGQSRSYSDILHQRGEPSSSLLATTLQNIWTYQAGTPFTVTRKNMPTTFRMDKLLRDYPAIYESLKVVEGFRKECRGLHIAPSIVTTLHFIFARKDPATADTFVHQLLTGEGLVKDTPIYACRDRLLRSSDPQLRPLSARDKGVLITRTWNLVREGAGPRSERAGRKRASGMRSRETQAGLFPEAV